MGRSEVSGEKLRVERDKIVRLWEERCLKEVRSAKTSASLALRDSMPLYINHLSEVFEKNVRMDFNSVNARDKESSRISRLHGAGRADNKKYELTEVIFEYHILREVIFQVLEEVGQLSKSQRDLILDSIEQAVNDAAVEFSESHTSIQQTFVNTLTHDLKNPISAAKMNAQMILRHTKGTSPTLLSAKRILGNIDRLESMIHDLLDASRLRSGEGLSLHVVDCNLDAMAREVVTEMSAIHGQRFVLNSPGPVEGRWDCRNLRRAVENLLGNAVKYSTPKTPITLSLQPSKEGVELTVHNEGPPIDEEDIALLFESFKRAKKAHESTSTGWGLGLTIVKGVVEAHKGKIRVESREGKGTSFILEIPAGERAEAGSRKSA